MKTIYVDNNATTKVAPEVVEAMLPYFTERYGNASSMHSFGGGLVVDIRRARTQVADLIGARPEEILFTSGGTESDATAIHAALQSNPDKRHIVTSRVEHPAIKTLFERYQKNGYRVTFVPVDGEGRLEQTALLESLSDDTAIVSLMWANNETGVINPIDDLSREVRARGILFHTDAVQTVGKIPIDVSQNGVDLLSMSAHKFHGPKGIGALYIRKGTKFKPMVVGGHQEGGRRAGTENVPGIVGMGRACALAGENLEDVGTRVRQLRDTLEQALLQAVPRSMANGGQAERLPNTTSIAFEYVEGEAILLLMNEYGICASSGSACTSGSLEPSHVLRAMGVPFTAAHGSIRYSLSHYTTREEVDYIVDKMPPIIERLRSMSPFWKQATEAAMH
ncbi:MAG: cysteine desulfurase NifS [Desulfobacteraceae bacterium]|nr:cysteine desulfurase NifS [Desulfobacteraceae bacterium]MBC2751142.1 cysteine desulfurase NifS [Desulfobacteraceae bacterium]